jgi:hypothetical protein
MRGNCGLEDVLNALHDEHILPEVFRSLCEYLTAAYLVSEIDDELLTASKNVCNRLLSAWESMIKKFTATYNDSSQWTAAAIAHQQCIVGGIFPCCAAYVRRLGPSQAEIVLKSIQRPDRKKERAKAADGSDEAGAEGGLGLGAGRNNSQLVHDVLKSIMDFERHGMNSSRNGVGTKVRGSEPCAPRQVKAAIGPAKMALQSFGQREEEATFDPKRKSVSQNKDLLPPLACFDKFVQATLRSEFIQERVSHEYDKLATAIEGVYKLTDPHDAAYQRADEITRKNDRRKNAISFEEMLARIVRFMHMPEQMGMTSVDDQELRVSLLVLLRRFIERQLRYGVAEHETHWQPLLMESAIKPVVPAALPSPYATIEQGFTAFLTSTLAVLESLPMMIFILAVVLCAILLPTDAGAELCGEWVLGKGFEYTLIAFFLVEVVVRLTCSGWYKYFTDPICLIDITCTLLDCAVVIYEWAMATGNTGLSTFSAGRILRGLRIFRIAKAVKAVNALNQLFFCSSTLAVNASIAREAHRTRQCFMVEAGVMELVESTLKRTDLPHCIRLGAMELGIRLLEYGNSDVQKELMELSVRSNNNQLLTNCVALMQRAGQAAAEVLTERCRKADASKKPARGEENNSSAEAAAMRLDSLPLLAAPSEGGESVYSTLMHETAMATKLLQQICEGHNIETQDFLREQPHADTAVNVVEAAGTLFCNLAGDQLNIKYGLGLEEIRVLVHLLDFMIEAVQGPCLANQRCLATKTRMLETISQLFDCRMARAREPHFIDASSSSSAYIYPQDCALLNSRTRWWKGAAEPLSLAYSPTLLKSRCSKFLFSMLEGVTDARLVDSIRSSLSHLSLRNRLKELFLLESYFTRHEHTVTKRIQMLSRDSELAFKDLTELKQFILNADPDKWVTELSAEGKLLTIVCLSLGRGATSGSYSQGMRGKADESVIGTDHDVRSNYEEATLAFFEMKEAKQDVDNETDDVEVAHAHICHTFTEGSKLCTLLGSPMAKHFKGISRSAHHQTKKNGVSAQQLRSRSAKNRVRALDAYEAPNAKHSSIRGEMGRMASSVSVMGSRRARVEEHKPGKMTEELGKLDQHCRKVHEQAVGLRSQQFFRDRIRSVEIVWRGELHTIHFTPPDTKKYMQHMCAELEKTEEVTSEDKLLGFIAKCRMTHKYMDFSVWLDRAKAPVVGQFVGSVYDVMSHFDQLEAFSFFIAVCNALLMLIGLQNEGQGPRDDERIVGR